MATKEWHDAADAWSTAVDIQIECLKEWRDSVGKPQEKSARAKYVASLRNQDAAFDKLDALDA